MFEEFADILGMIEVESGVDFIKDVHGRRLELEKGHDERQSNQRAM
jgi:hypothetical protein